jgi:primosomal protein N' (replication factor Y)
MTYVEIAIAKLYTGNKVYSYASANNVKVGSIVKVPFGKKTAWGIVLSIVKKPTFKTKELLHISPYVLPKGSLETLAWMISFYPDDAGQITQLFLPNNLSLKPRPVQKHKIIGRGKKLPRAHEEQAKAIKLLSDNKNDRILLHGDTGTGKTRVFLERTIQILDSGKSVLILTPEIGLTPQLANDLKSYIKAPIILTHSELAGIKRHEAWEYALNNKIPSVFVGPRSALFLPIQNLGLIVLDEAHDKSYKQGQSPRYHSLNVAGKLASISDAQIVHSTATPNVDEYEIAKAHDFKIIRILEQAAGNKQNTIKLVDITDRSIFKQSPYLSDPLVHSIDKALKNNQQAMLFLNRRGSARLVQCSSCGWQAICPNCGVPLIYHQDFHHIICHWCGFKQSAPSNCPTCNSTELEFKIIGTKALFEHCRVLFPKAKIMRFDADSAVADKLHLHIETLKNREVDIVIGTQLISKGIDLPYLSVVGVINADTGMNLPDYRAEETTFQQLYQVTGRAGRGRISSTSFIQTRLLEHPAMKAITDRSWDDFYKYEINKRRQFSYPPFCYLGLFKVSKTTLKSAQIACVKAKDLILNDACLKILGPSPSFYEKSKSGFTWQLIVKSTSRKNIVEAARKLPSFFTVDIDPASLL